MSGRRGEKKPLSNKVQTLNDRLARHRGVRNLEKRFLIVCEDDKSAPHYFEALRKDLNLSAISVKVHGSRGRSQPLQVVKYAIEIAEASKGPESGTEPFEHVWCVIDGDYGPKIHNAREMAKAHGVELAISTKCFEYWVLLHFEESDTSSADCAEVVRSLRRKHVKDYDKGKYDFRDVVKRVSLASERAKKLRTPGIKRGDLPESQNPCSEVYRLVDEIVPGGD